MMPHDLHRSAVDDAIDCVARDMTSGAPSAAFRRGLMARLESPQPKRFAWPMVAAGVAAMAVVAMAVVAIWPERSHPVQSTVTMRTPAPIFVPPASPTTSAEVVTAPQRTAPSAPAFESAIAGLPPIERPDPITQESIQPERLSIPQLRIDAIVMPPVDDDGSGQE